MAEKRVVIEHKDGRNYGIPLAAFDKLKVEGDKTYKDLGFEIIRYEDGDPYTEPAKAKGDEPKAGGRSGS